MVQLYQHLITDVIPACLVQEKLASRRKRRLQSLDTSLILSESLLPSHTLPQSHSRSCNTRITFFILCVLVLLFFSCIFF